MLGLFVLVVILAVSNLLHLLVLATVMQYLLLGTAVGLPIVFQPELRRGLEQLGRGRLFVRDRRAEDEIAAEQIRIVAHAGFVLARQRVGALIVIEQQTGLREYVESGTALDARLSLDLVLAIFNKTSPLHDGAVIVRDLLIEGAACFLPLSDNTICGRPPRRHASPRRGRAHRADRRRRGGRQRGERPGLGRARRPAVGADRRRRAAAPRAGSVHAPDAPPRSQAEGGLLANLLTRIPRAQPSQEQLRT